MTPYKVFPKNYKDIIKLYTGGLSAAEIARVYDVSVGCIMKILIKLKIDRRAGYECRKLYTVNQTFFQNIDNKYKAYFLGLLFADGYNDEKRGVVTIALTKRDLHIIKSFRKYLNSNAPIRLLKTKGKRSICRGEEIVTRADSFRIRICSITMSKNLTFLGCFQNKSLKLKFPSYKICPKQFLSHFIRGFFDGDGSVSYLKNGRRCMNFVGGYCFLSVLRRVLLKNTAQDTYLSRKKGKSFMLSAQDKRADCILKWIYEDSDKTIRLKRKFNIFKK